MGIQSDYAGAKRAGDRFKGAAGRMDQASLLTLTVLARRIAPEAVRDMQTTHKLAYAKVRASVSARRVGESVELVGKDRPTGLLQYGAKYTKRNGVRVTIRRDGREIQFERAFIATGQGGNRQVFERKGRSRLPIGGKFGPSPAQILRNPERRERLGTFGHDVAAAEFHRQMERL
jgi:hypothetical protein